MRRPVFLALVLLAQEAILLVSEVTDKKHHHHKHHHKHQHASQEHVPDTTAGNTGTSAGSAVAQEPSTAMKVLPKALDTATVHVLTKAATQVDSSNALIRKRMKSLDTQLGVKEAAGKGMVMKGMLEVNGPLPADFSERFVQAVANAAHCDTDQVKVIDIHPLNSDGDIAEVVFEAPLDVVHCVENQAADPYSKLANSPLHDFLVAKDGPATQMSPETALEHHSRSTHSTSPVRQTGIDIDTAMPYGELEPFGREDTAQELTEQSVRESDEMVDQLERAEVAEEKRAVFRALTRLRGAAITSFDGVARSQTGNIDEYNKVHKWRITHPLHHLADEESDITKWAFPDNAD
jgi:hypothetical protein